MSLTRRGLLQVSAATIVSKAAHAQVAAPVLIGVSGPLTGQYAQYGVQWKRGFDLALDEINASGGIGGRKLVYDFQDSQSDPRQAVGIAQKFVSNPDIVVEVGDFSSAASMAASPIYQRGGLVQFGFTNSHPDFTKGGDFMWSNSPSQAEDSPLLAKFAVGDLGLRRLAVLYINSDWGRTSEEIFSKTARDMGAQVAVAEGYLPAEKDFRATLVRVGEADPDGIILVSYYPDGALICRQIRASGLKQKVVAASSVYSPKFLEIGGDAVNGVYTETTFFPEDPRPYARKFVADYDARYQVLPDNFSARAYDTMILLATVMRTYGTDRRAIRDGLGKAKDVPSVVFGTVTFDLTTRRAAGPSNIPLIVKDGKFAAWSA
jgi:branched-chain amino acid transport system substrate-binding protein